MAMSEAVPLHHGLCPPSISPNEARPPGWTELLWRLPQAALRSCFHRFLKCVACRSPLNTSNHSLCLFCQQSLIPAPPLCPSCAGPLEGPNDEDPTASLQPQEPLPSENAPHLPLCSPLSCRRPWAQMKTPSGQRAIDSFQAEYLLVGRGYTVIKRWKAQQGSGLHAHVLKPPQKDPLLWLAQDFDGIVPIPQAFERAFARGGNPSERIAQWIHFRTGRPIQRLLRWNPDTQSPGHSQAKSNLQARLEPPADRYLWNASVLPGWKNRKSCSAAAPPLRRILLVDDVLTTGRTVGQAAVLLKNHGIEVVHVYTLGVKLFQFRSK
jgi:predicted amidophosphoribosyltransferase